ncbi:MAG: RluA family pseudouridine synthase [Planctomycetaceae bacterium]|nr:RluA family pseudouridine synthase [Planctomycetaceae bacterium]
MSESLPPLEILSEDGPLLAVNKPAGLPTQAPAAFPSLEARVKQWLKERFDKPGNVYLGIPHRLDRPVSGVVVFGRNSKVAARLSEQFQQREVRKTYWAILEFPPPQPEGELRDWLRKIPDVAQGEVVAEGHPEGREAVLRYRTLGPSQRPTSLEGRWPELATLVEIELMTGRMHQIRLQFASRGCPIVGDVRYGSTTGVSMPSETRSEERIWLHARELVLKHPIRYDTVTISAPVPAGWPA